MLHLVTTALAVFAVWEYLLGLLPVTIPSWVQPVLVAGFAVGAQKVPDRVLTVIAVTGAVAVCHACIAAPRIATVEGRRRARVPGL